MGLLGLPEKPYASHSLRIGATSTAAAVGMKDWEINMIGGWKKKFTYQGYIKDMKQHVAAFSRNFVKLTEQ